MRPTCGLPGGSVMAPPLRLIKSHWPRVGPNHETVAVDNVFAAGICNGLPFRRSEIWTRCGSCSNLSLNGVLIRLSRNVRTERFLERDSGANNISEPGSEPRQLRDGLSEWDLADSRSGLFCNDHSNRAIRIGDVSSDDSDSGWGYGDAVLLSQVITGYFECLGRALGGGFPALKGPRQGMLRRGIPWK